MTASDVTRSLAQLAQPERALVAVSGGVRLDRGRHDGYASILSSLFDRLSGESDVLMVAPSVGLASADRVPLAYAAEFARDPEAQQKVTILTTDAPELTRSWLLPPLVRHQLFDESVSSLTAERRHQLLAQLIVLVAPKTVLAIDSGELEATLDQWGRQLAQSTNLKLFLSRPPAFSAAESRYSPAPSIFTTDEASARVFASILGVESSSIGIHAHPALDQTPDFDSVVQYTAAFDDVDFSEQYPLRLAVTQLAGSAGLDVLARIVEQVAELGLPIEFHVHSDGAAFDADIESRLSDLASKGVHNHGEFARGLASLPTETYHGLVLTEAPAGIPISVVQALLLGVPIIGPVSAPLDSLVRNRETGLVLSERGDAADYLAAFQALMESRDLRRTLIRNGHAAAVSRQDHSAFREAVRADLAEAWQVRS